MPASPRTQQKRPGDLTGVRGQHLAKARDEHKAQEKAQIEDALQAERLAREQAEVDYTSEARKKAREASQSVVIEEGDLEAKPRTRRIRVNWEIQDMTFGREVITPAEYDDQGNVTRQPVLGALRTFSFEPKRWYTVDNDVYEHLLYLGYIYGD